jgi:hypothetical protein
MISNTPSLALITQDQARALVAERLAGRDWWILPWLSRHAVAVSVALEERHYSGAAGADFEVVATPVEGMLPVSLARKRRCSPGQLAALLVRLGCPERRARLARDLVVRDLLLLGDPAEAMPRMEAFVTWLSTDPAARYWRERRN